jgi:hypothetical protein
MKAGTDRASKTVAPCRRCALAGNRFTLKPTESVHPYLYRHAQQVLYHVRFARPCKALLQRLYNKRRRTHRESLSLHHEITDMANDLTITYFVSHDMLGVPSDEEVEHFKDLLLEGLQDEWPEAEVVIEDDETAHADISGLSGQSLQDVQDRVDDIVNEILDAGANDY